MTHTLPYSIRRLTLACCVGALVATGCGGDSPEKLVSSAKDFIAKSDYNAAVIQLRTSLQKVPKNAEARYLLGQALLETGDPATAEKEFRKALELEYPADQAVPPLTRAMVEQGLFEKLLSEFGKTQLGAAEANAELQTNIGNANLGQRQIEGARTAFLSAVTYKADYPRAVIGQARLKLIEKDYAGAEAMLDQVVKAAPKLPDTYFVKAELAIRQDKVEEAIQSYEKVVAIRPDNVLAHYNIVSLLAQTGKTDEAGTKLARMKKAVGGHPMASFLQGLLAFRQKNTQLAYDSVMQALKAAPNHLPSALLAGMVEYERSNYSTAEQHLGKVLELAPNHLLARRFLVNTMLRNKQPTRALEALQPLLKQAPNNADVMALAAEVYMQNNDQAESIKYSERAAKLDPEDSRKRTRLALSRLAAGDASGAFNDLEEASAADPNSFQADVVLAMTHINRKEYAKAFEAIATLEKKQPNNPLTHNLRASAHFSKGELPQARASLEKAVSIDPAYFPAVFNLAKLDLQQGKPDDARKRFEALLAKEPKNVQAMLAMARLLAENNAPPAEALSLIEKAVGANPTSAPARLALIDHHSRARDWKRANTVAQEAHAVLPNDPLIVDALAVVQKNAGEANQAVSSLQKLVTLQPTSPVPLLKLADLQSELGSQEEALQTLKKALSLAPKSAEAKRAMALINVKLGRGEEALKIANEVKADAPKSEVGDVLEGDVRAAQRKWDEAASAYRAAMEKSKSPVLTAKLHTALASAGRNPEAEKAAGEYLRANAKDVFLRSYLAEYHLRRGELEPAARYYKAVLEVAPKNALALNNYAWVRWQLKDKKGLEMAEEANRIAPNSPAIMDTLGWMLVENGEMKRGVELLRQAIAMSPPSHDIRLHLAKALVKAGDKDGARRELQVLSRLGDQFQIQAEAAKILGSL